MEKSWKATGDEYAPSHDINCRCTSTDKIVGIKTSRGILDTKTMSFAELIETARKNGICTRKK